MSVSRTSRSAPDEHGHLRGEEVVVAERHLVGRRRVVLVDDRHDPPLEQPRQRPARVEVVRAGADVEEGEQHLGALDPALAQQLVVGPVEAALADGAGRLQVLDRGRARAHAEQAHAAGDRAAGDDDDVDALVVERGDLLADARDDGQAQLAVVLGDDRRSQLDDGDRHVGPQLRRGPARTPRRPARRRRPVRIPGARARRSRPCAAAGARRAPAPPRWRGRGARSGGRPRRR